MGSVREFILHPDSEETSSGNGESFDTLVATSGLAHVGSEIVRILFVVTAVGPNSAIDLKIEGITDSGNVCEIGTFPQLGTTTSTSIEILVCPRRIRCTWFIRGLANASVTFECIAVRIV